jgi:transcriptional regulator with XRE-family HTH domain
MEQLMCDNASMPSVDPEAKAFQMSLAARFGNAVSARRKALQLTASELARQTAELGYPISRGAIAQIESNSRSGKIDVAELLVLAAALNIPPVLLLFHDFPDEEPVEMLPGVRAYSADAVRWVSGFLSLPPKRHLESGGDQAGIIKTRRGDVIKANEGVQLVTADIALDKAEEDRVQLTLRVLNAQRDGGDADVAEQMVKLHDQHIEWLQRQVRSARRLLWGTLSSNEAPQSDD